MVMIIRQSGNPVDREEQGKFEEEWKKGFDNLYESEMDQETIADKAESFHKKLVKKYGTEEKIDLPKSLRAWKSLLDKYDQSILLTKNPETGKLVVVIMDLGL
jgi:putative transposon-encoded protein